MEQKKWAESNIMIVLTTLGITSLLYGANAKKHIMIVLMETIQEIANILYAKRK